MTVERDGQQRSVTLNPVRSAEGDRWVVGISLKQSYDLPAQVQYNLDGVGGPSAGLMLALGTVDKLSEGSLLADEDAGGDPYRSYVSGTGTIDPNGKVGAIGGIRPRFWQRAATVRAISWPQENCDSVLKMQEQDPSMLNYYHAGRVVADGGDSGVDAG